MRKKWQISLLVIATGCSCYYCKYVYAYMVLGKERYNALPGDVRNNLINITVMVLCVLVTLVLQSFSVRAAADILGFRSNMVKALAVALICTSPMLVGGYCYGGYNEDITFNSVLNAALLPGFFEEFLFRAFITGLLVRMAKWHFLPAAIISGALFAWGHLYQAHSMGDAVLIFLFASGAGIGFALFYKLWNWNIWFPIFMHQLMNLSFVLFNMGSTMLLNRTANIARGITIVLAVGFTIYEVYKRKKAERIVSR